MSHVNSTLLASLCGAVALAGNAMAQNSPSLGRADLDAPIFAGTFHVASGTFTPASADPHDGTPDPVIFNSNYYTGFFYDIDDGTIVYDEGRLPSPTSPTPMSGLEKHAYRVTGLQLGYVTDSTVPVSMRFRMWHQYATCTDPASLPAPIVNIVIPNMKPTIQAGSFTPFAFNVDMTGLEFCALADGDGVYSNGFSDRFGWSLQVVNGGDGTGTGPILGTRPGTPFAPVLDGTVFQNPGAPAGSGLAAEDQWWDVDPMFGSNCFNFGGYNPTTGNPPSGSFWLQLRSDLSVDCTGCANGIDDGFEPNDTCATAVMLPGPGVYGPLVVRDPDEDFYDFVVPVGNSITCVANFLNSQADIDLTLRTAACPGTSLSTSGSTSNSETVRFFNCGPAPTVVRLRAFVFGTTTNCGDYTLTVTLDGTCAIDDLLEENDTCGTAVPLALGFTAGLRIRSCDEDYYIVDADPGESFTITAFFSDVVADLDLYLLQGPTCGTTLTSSTSTTNDEQITWTNTTGQVQVYRVFVDWFPAGATANCSTYSLLYEIVPATEIGLQFCTAELNSTGQGAHILATGSDVAANNNVTLRCRFLPLNVFGFFLNSKTNVFVPFPGGSLGNLCIGGPLIGRYNAPAEIQNSGPTGTVALMLNLPMTPRPSFFEPILATQTWYFQYWYRDVVMAMPVSNWSDGLRIIFN